MLGSASTHTPCRCLTYTAFQLLRTSILSVLAHVQNFDTDGHIRRRYHAPFLEESRSDSVLASRAKPCVAMCCSSAEVSATREAPVVGSGRGSATVCRVASPVIVLLDWLKPRLPDDKLQQIANAQVG